MISQEQTCKRRKELADVVGSIYPASLDCWELRSYDEVLVDVFIPPNILIPETLMVMVHDDRKMQAANVDRWEVEEDGVMRDWWTLPAN